MEPGLLSHAGPISIVITSRYAMRNDLETRNAKFCQSRWDTGERYVRNDTCTVRSKVRTLDRAPEQPAGLVGEAPLVERGIGSVVR